MYLQKIKRKLILEFRFTQFMQT